MNAFWNDAQLTRFVRPEAIRSPGLVRLSLALGGDQLAQLDLLDRHLGVGHLLDALRHRLLEVGGEGDVDLAVVDDEAVLLAALLDVRPVELDVRDVILGVERDLGRLRLDDQVVAIRVFGLSRLRGPVGVGLGRPVLEGRADEGVPLDVLDLDEEGEPLVQLAVLLEVLEEDVLEALEEDLPGPEIGPGDGVARDHEHDDAQDDPERERRSEDRPGAQSGRLDGDDLIVPREPAVDDRDREQERDGDGVREAHRDHVRDERADLDRREAHLGGLAHDHDEHEHRRDRQERQEERAEDFAHHVALEDSEPHPTLPASMPGSTATVYVENDRPTNSTRSRRQTAGARQSESATASLRTPSTRSASVGTPKQSRAWLTGAGVGSSANAYPPGT